MSVLAFDTTMNACAIAVCRDGEVLARTVIEMKHGQAEALVPAVEDTLRSSGQTYESLECIAVTTGPGSFTGVRVGLATARGLGLAIECPVIGLGTAEVLAATARRRADNASVASVIDARRAEVYVQIYDSNGTASISPQCVLPEDVAVLLPDGDLCLTGDAVERVEETLDHPVRTFPQHHGDPQDLALLATTRDPVDAPASPLYVRPPDAKTPKHGGRLRP